MRSVRIPFLIDLKRIDDKPDIAAASRDQRLDRDFVSRGPLVNRILTGLKRRGKTVVVITHDDRYFHCADHIVKLDFGQVVDIKSAAVVRPLVRRPPAANE